MLAVYIGPTYPKAKLWIFVNPFFLFIHVPQNEFLCLSLYVCVFLFYVALLLKSFCINRNRQVGSRFQFVLYFLNTRLRLYLCVMVLFEPLHQLYGDNENKDKPTLCPFVHNKMTYSQEIALRWTPLTMMTSRFPWNEYISCKRNQNKFRLQYDNRFALDMLRQKKKGFFRMKTIEKWRQIIVIWEKFVLKEF